MVISDHMKIPNMILVVDSEIQCLFALVLAQESKIQKLGLFVCNGEQGVGILSDSEIKPKCFFNMHSKHMNRLYNTLVSIRELSPYQEIDIKQIKNANYNGMLITLEATS